MIEDLKNTLRGLTHALMKYGLLFFMFGGIGLILLVSKIEQVISVQVPEDKLLSRIPVDSSSIKSPKLLFSDRNGDEASALRFDGEVDFLSYDGSIGSLAEDFSFCFWLNVAKPGKEQTLFQKGENCADGDPDFKGLAYQIGLSEENILSMRIVAPKGNESAEFIDFSTNESLPMDKWVFIVITYNNALKQFEYFADSSPRSFQTASKSAVTNFEKIFQTRAPLKIGASENYCGNIHAFGNFFKGQLDDIRIFSVALNEKEVQVMNVSNESTFLKYRIAILVLTFAFILGVIRTHYKSK